MIAAVAGTPTNVCSIEQVAGLVNSKEITIQTVDAAGAIVDPTVGSSLKALILLNNSSVQ